MPRATRRLLELIWTPIGCDLAWFEKILVWPSEFEIDGERGDLPRWREIVKIRSPSTDKLD